MAQGKVNEGKIDDVKGVTEAILAESAEKKAAAEKNGSKLNQVIGMLQSKTKGHAGPQWSAIIIDIRVRELGTLEWISEDLSRDLLGLELEKLAFFSIDRTS